METAVNHQRDLVSYPMANWKPVQLVPEHRRYVVIPFFEGDQSGCCIKNALKPLGNGDGGTNKHTVAVVHARRHERMNEGQGGVSCECAANRAQLFQLVETRAGNTIGV